MLCYGFFFSLYYTTLMAAVEGRHDYESYNDYCFTSLIKMQRHIKEK